MKVETVVNALVTQLLSTDLYNEAIHFHLDCRLNYFEDGKRNYRTARALHLLYQRHTGSTYISAFSAVLDNPFDKIDKVKDWNHECTHDYCWRSVNCFSAVYFSMAEDINRQLVKAGLSEVAPIDMREFNSFGGISGNVFQLVPVKVELDPTDKNHHRRMITVSPIL